MPTHYLLGELVVHCILPSTISILLHCKCMSIHYLLGELVVHCRLPSTISILLYCKCMSIHYLLGELVVHCILPSTISILLYCIVRQHITSGGIGGALYITLYYKYIIVLYCMSIHYLRGNWWCIVYYLVL